MPDRSPSRRLWRTLAVIGPGVVAMLADTDVGSLVTAAQSGARWGYSLVYLQFLLVPVLYVVQELTARLGAVTGKGHGALIQEHIGPVWAWISFAGLAVAGLGAVATELSGLAGIGDLFGVPRWASLGVPILLLVALVYTGSYKRVERLSIAVGLFELVFLWLAWRAHPDLRAMAASVASAPIGQGEYRTLIAANIGAVIMPWMIFYQQSAVADKGLKPEDRRGMQWDTLGGAIVSQMVMAALLVAAAAALHKQGQHAGLQTVGDLAKAFTPALGQIAGKIVLGVGIVAAAFISLNVVSLALAWGLGDVTGVAHSVDASPTEAPVFYAVYTVVILLGAGLVELIHNLVALNIAVEVMNALLLPLALGLPVLLARRALPEEHRLSGAYKWLVYVVSAVTIAAGLVGGVGSLVS